MAQCNYHWLMHLSLVMALLSTGYYITCSYQQVMVTEQLALASHDYARVLQIFSSCLIHKLQMAKIDPAAPKSLLLSNAVVPLSYGLSLSIDHKKPNFTGKVLVPLVANDKCHSTESGFSLTLHASRIIVTKAALNYDLLEHSLKISYSRDVQTVTLSSDINVTDILSQEPNVEISFMGSVTSIKTFHDETYGVFKTNYSDSIEGKSDNFVIATHAQPFGCRAIFPVIDECVHKVPIKLSITTKSTFKVISNGALEKSTIADMTADSVFEFKLTPPIAPSVFGFVAGDFECVESADSKVPIRIFATKGEGSRATYALKVASDLLPRFVELFGIEYPLEKFDLVALPFLSDWVMENWGMVTVIRDSLLLDEATAPESAKLQLRQLIAHQLTHQWIGNLISFDEFKWMWLIEAFATWVGNYVLSLAKIEAADYDNYKLDKTFELEALKDFDCSEHHLVTSFHDHMNQLNVNSSSRTNTIFEKNAYDKGMVLLNMIGSLFQLEKQADTLDPFFKALKAVFLKYQFKTIKPFEMWSVLNEEISVDLLSFVHSWIQYTGYPLLKVKFVKNKLIIIQNKYLREGEADELQIENQPYHVPLAMKLVTDDGNIRYANLMLSDRSTELEIPLTKLISLNADRQFYYSVVYDATWQKSILEHIRANRLSSLDLIGLINDYGKILGLPIPKKDSELFGSNELLMLISICTVIAGKSWELDYNVLKVLLGFVEVINVTFVHFSEYDQFKEWLGKFSLELFHKIGGWDDVLLLKDASYKPIEYEVRGLVLQLGISNKACSDICQKLYKNFFNAGVAQKFIPKELLASMFNVTMAHANMNEYKHVLNLVKNADVSHLKHTNAGSQDLQTAAVASLAFTSKDELLGKTLHFVNNNIDSKLIELALIGFKYHHSSHVKEKLWAWYRVNYDQWIKRSLRKGSSWSKQIGITVGNITRLVLGEVMQYKHSAVEEFVKTKLKTLPPHGLEDQWKAIEQENVEKTHIAGFYEEMVNAFSM